MNQLELEIESIRVLLGQYGNAQERIEKLDALGIALEEPDCRVKIQNYVNRLVRESQTLRDALADYILAGKAGSGDARAAHLGDYYSAAQERVNEILQLRGLSDQHVRAVLVNGGFGADPSVCRLRLRACGYDADIYMPEGGTSADDQAGGGMVREPGGPAQQQDAKTGRTGGQPQQQDTKTGRSGGQAAGASFRLFFINHERYTWRDNWGDNCLVESDGKYLLMDSCMPAGRDAILNFLKTRKITKLSLYISHPHYDHYGNAMAILTDPFFTIEHLYLCKYGQISGIDDASGRRIYD